MGKKYSKYLIFDFSYLKQCRSTLIEWILHSDVVRLRLSGNDSASNLFEMTCVSLSMCVCVCVCVIGGRWWEMSKEGIVHTCIACYRCCVCVIYVYKCTDMNNALS